jgi:hypothetical protein
VSLSTWKNEKWDSKMGTEQRVENASNMRVFSNTERVNERQTKQYRKREGGKLRENEKRQR